METKIPTTCQHTALRQSPRQAPTTLEVLLCHLKTTAHVLRMDPGCRAIFIVGVNKVFQNLPSPKSDSCVQGDIYITLDNNEPVNLPCRQHTAYRTLPLPQCVLFSTIGEICLRNGKPQSLRRFETRRSETTGRLPSISGAVRSRSLGARRSRMGCFFTIRGPISALPNRRDHADIMHNVACSTY